MTFVPDNATLCGCAVDLPLDSSERVGGFARPSARRGCPKCGGRGWYMERERSCGGVSAPTPTPPDEIEPLPTSIGIREGRGGSDASYGGTLIPPAFADAFVAEGERIARAFAADLDREFLVGDGSPAPPPPRFSLRARVAWWVRRARIDTRRRIASARYRYVRLPRERLGKRVAPTLLTDDEAQDRYGDW